MENLATEPDEIVFHLIPNEDGFDHEDSNKCMCGPTVSFEFPGDDEPLPSGAVIYIHHGLDGNFFKYLPA